MIIRFKELRINKGLTIEQLAKDLSISVGEINKVEEQGNSSIEVLKAYAKYFDVTSDYLLGLADKENMYYNKEETTSIKNSSKVYIHYGHTKFDKNLFAKIKNTDYRTKPEGGLWASDVNAGYGWKDWCRENLFRDCNEENSFSFVLADNTKVLYINSAKDLELLQKIEDVSGFKFSIWTLLDFEKLSETYDAIEVNISNDHDLYYQLYGWDCDSILVMNPEIVKEIRKE